MNLKRAKHPQNKSTQLQLKRQLRTKKRIAFLGIGHPLRGDDAAGLFFIRSLLRAVKSHHKKLKPKPTLFEEIKLSKNRSLLLIEGGASPENYTGLIRNFKPDFLIIIDAADMNTHAGTIKIVPNKKIASLYSTSTHRMPPKLLIQYLSLENPHLKILWLLIQPKKVPLLSQTISSPLKTTITNLAKSIIKTMT